MLNRSSCSNLKEDNFSATTPLPRKDIVNPITQAQNSNMGINNVSTADINSEEFKIHGPKSKLDSIVDEPFQDFSNEHVQAALDKLGEFIYDMDKINLVNAVYLPPIYSKLSDSIYKGQWKNGQKHGKGIVYWTDGSRFEGYFENDHANGKGRLIHNNGDSYIGDWLNGKSHGKGLYIKRNGALYDGFWKDDKKHGKAKEIYPDGTIFEGEYIDGRKENKGKLIFSDGNYYEGEFLQNEMHGNGVYLWKNGKKYKGEWKASKMHGKGETIFPDGRLFIGKYANDKEVYGEMIYSDGSKYIGPFHNGLRHGCGKFVDPFGKESTGLWEHGQLVESQDFEILDKIEAKESEAEKTQTDQKLLAELLIFSKSFKIKQKEYSEVNPTEDTNAMTVTTKLNTLATARENVETCAI